ncbi:hypothetical protein PC116_g30549 [Phytophthora cactorum]|nr:hypothetical protein PC116_g30549 [Phytophthora cactorum]
MTVKGTSRITVMLHPRYSSRHTPASPISRCCDSIAPRAAALEPPCKPACARCLTTSVGTRTAQAATSPRLAATMCSAGSSQVPRTPLSNSPCIGSSPILLLLLFLPALFLSSLLLASTPFTPSYVQKKKAAPGALPTTALPTPRYMPRKPPDGKKPSRDWRRVFRVSRGKSDRSTVVPAMPPARRAVAKGGWEG